MSFALIARTPCQLRYRLERDRMFRRRVSPDEAWRGCLGLGLLLSRPDDTFYHGHLAMVRNEQLHWLALRDCPERLRPRPCQRTRRCVRSLPAAALATLCHGMPAVRMSELPHLMRDAGLPDRWMDHPDGFERLRRKVRHSDRPDDPDRQPRPLREAERLAAVFAAMSVKMTRFAFGALDSRGWPRLRAWGIMRPWETRSIRPGVVPPGVPRPYLGFPIEQRSPLIDRLLASWPANPAFRSRFAHALSQGLPLQAVGPEVLKGVTPPATASTSVSATSPTTARPLAAAGAVGVTSVMLESRIDGSLRQVLLPAGARLLANLGQEIDAGDVWAVGWPVAVRSAEATRGLVLASRNAAGMSAGASGSRTSAGAGAGVDVRRLWLEHQVVRLSEAPDEVLIDAELLSAIAAATPATSIWWDSAPMMPFYDWMSQAAVLPPIALQTWDNLRLTLPGQTLLDARPATTTAMAPAAA